MPLPTLFPAATLEQLSAHSLVRKPCIEDLPSFLPAVIAGDIPVKCFRMTFLYVITLLVIS